MSLKANKLKFHLKIFLNLYLMENATNVFDTFQVNPFNVCHRLVQSLPQLHHDYCLCLTQRLFRFLVKQ